MFKKLAVGLGLVASMGLLALTTAGAKGPPPRTDLGYGDGGQLVVVGWVQSTFWDRTTIHLHDALPNTEFVVTSQYWTGTATCGDPSGQGTMLTGSMRTDARGKGVGKFGYTGGAPAGVSLINWGVGHWIGPGEFDYDWDYWTECMSVPSG